MKKFLIKVGARTSPLSKAQVLEVHLEICKQHPHIEFESIYVETTGDKDHTTSLRSLDKTDFFTKEIDTLLLEKKCRLAIHSAKDLPDPIPQGLTLAAITKGLDAADVLVLRPRENLDTLPPGAIIATSSARREEMVKDLKNDLSFCDVRGTIGERLALLEKKQVDGVVVAEAAIIRLGLTHLNRIRLQGKTADYQGQLAILCRTEDQEMLDLFQCLDSRQKKPRVLFLGLDLPEESQNDPHFIHYPLIRIEDYPSNSPAIQESFKEMLYYTHILFTSKSAVHAFFRHFSQFGYKKQHLQGKEVISVGQQTAKVLRSYGIAQPLISSIETAEGMIELLNHLQLENAYMFWPHSAISRTVISQFLIQRKVRFKECVVYDTVINKPLKPIDLNSIDEIYFTSPSTVDAFIAVFGSLPRDKVLKAIGPITEERLNNVLTTKPESSTH